MYRHAGLAVAALMVLAVGFLLMNMLLSARNGDTHNMFTLRVFALEQQADDSVMLREVDLIAQTDVWGGFLHGETFFLSITLRAEGENIQSVSFSTEDGFFAKQRLKIENGIIIFGDESVLHLGEDSDIVVFGGDFEIIGSNFVLSSDGMEDDLLLFLGATMTDGQIPPRMTIHAVASFYDGTTQTETIELSLEDRWGIWFSAGFDESMPVHDGWWIDIDLDEAELVTDLLIVITDADNGEIEFHIDGFPEPLVLDESQLVFDEHGIGWGSYMSDFRISDRNVYFVVAERDDDGALTGMVYRVKIEGEEMGTQSVVIN